MATTLWKIPFQAVNGDDYRVEIKVEVGSGTAATLTGGASPIVTEEDDDDDLFLPVRTQSGYIQFVDDGSNLGAVMPSSSTDRMVMLYKRTGPYFPGDPTGWTGELVWKGYLQPQSFSGEYLRSPQIRELPICCPLSVLDSWDVEVGVSSGFANFAAILYYIFSKLGTADPSSSDEGYWFAFHAGNQTVNWLSKRVLWDSLGGEDEEGNAEAKYTCLELLEHVCNFFGWICRIEGKTVYFSTPDFNNGEFKRISLSGLADIANGSTPSMSSVLWYSESLDYGEVFASRRNTETLVRGIRKATVNAQVDAYDTILEIPFDKIAKSVRSNAVYRNQIYPAIPPEGDDPGRPAGYFYWRFIPYLAGHRFGNVRITTNRGNSGGSDTKHFQGRIDDYEFYEGGTKDKHNYALTTDLYIVGMAGKTQTSAVVISEPTGLIINADTADNQHEGWIIGDNTQPDTIGQVTIQVNALATIETVRSVVLSCGVLVLEGILKSEYVRNGHTSVSPTGTLSVRVSVGNNYYIYLGDGDGYWSQNPDSTTKETDCWLDVPVKDGVIATTRVLTAPYPAYEGFGMLVHAPGGNVTRVEGKVKVEIRGWEPKTEEPVNSGTIYNRDDEGDSSAPASSFVHFDGSDTNVHISSLSLKFLRHNNFVANAERSSNKYTAAGSNLFRDTKTVDTIWYTDNGNNYGKGIVMEANGGYLQKIYFGTTDDRPEQHLANRIATYYGIPRRLYRLDLIMDAIPTLTPSKYLKIYGGITTYPVALKRDWRDNRCEVTALLMAGSGNHAPNDPERPEEETVPVTVNLTHVIVKNDIPDVVEKGGTLSLELEAEPGYQITSVVATVGGDVAEDVWDEEWGLLMIWNIEYEVVVTAVAVEIPIEFEDDAVKAICVANWGGHVIAGEITVQEAADVQLTSTDQPFQGNTNIRYFDELRYFTNITYLAAGTFTNGKFYNCSNLERVTIPKCPMKNLVGVFRGCTSLVELDITPAKTTDMIIRGLCYMGTGATGAALTKIKIPGTTYDLNFESFARGASNLTTLEIDGTADFSGLANFTNAFSNCSSLTTITGTITGINAAISLSYSPLSRASALVIINGLADRTGETQLTLNLSDSTIALLTSDDIAIATAKNWAIT